MFFYVCGWLCSFFFFSKIRCFIYETRASQEHLLGKLGKIHPDSSDTMIRHLINTQNSASYINHLLDVSLLFTFEIIPRVFTPLYEYSMNYEYEFTFNSLSLATKSDQCPDLSVTKNTVLKLCTC